MDEAGFTKHQMPNATKIRPVTRGIHQHRRRENQARAKSNGPISGESSGKNSFWHNTILFCVFSTTPLLIQVFNIITMPETKCFTGVSHECQRVRPRSVARAFA